MGWPWRAIVLLLAGSLVLGVAHVALLPPWEGFDESPHYSYLQQLADRWVMPRRPVAQLSTNVEAYMEVGPLRYGTKPPMEETGALTYRTFFSASPDVITRVRALVHDRPTTAREFQPGSKGNWEVQHPPLYYALLVPLYRATRHWSLGAQLFVLRLESYLLAWLALVIGVLSCRAAAIAATRSAASGAAWLWAAGAIAVWPVLLPAWFPEMARLGNDALCALLGALVWAVSLRAWHRGLTLWRAATLGALVGAGGLTKALFVPAGVGLLGFWTIDSWRRGGGPALRAVAPRLALGAGVALGVSGWWYLGNALRDGVALGAGEMIAVARRGGLLTGLPEQFTVFQWARGHVAALATFVWCGTWSWARPPHLLFLPLMTGVVVAALGYVAALARFRWLPLLTWPLWVVSPVVLGLSYHVLLRLTLVAEGRGTGGYYLHAFVVPLGVAGGIAAGTWLARPGVRRAALGLAGYAVAFGVVVSWAQLLLFAGIAFKAGNNRFYQLPPSLPPWLGVPTALTRLEVLAFPWVGAVAWLVGAVLALAGLVSLGRAVVGWPSLTHGPVAPPRQHRASARGVFPSRIDACRDEVEQGRAP